jgi:hypothetical protein
MTTFADRYNAHLAADARHRYALAQREAEREVTAYETWWRLLQEGQYRRAREWWFAEIERQEG